MKGITEKHKKGWEKKKNPRVKEQMKPAKWMDKPYIRFTNYISCELAWTRICYDGVQKGNMTNWQFIN